MVLQVLTISQTHFFVAFLFLFQMSVKQASKTIRAVEREKIIISYWSLVNLTM